MLIVYYVWDGILFSRSFFYFLNFFCVRGGETFQVFAIVKKKNVYCSVEFRKK